MKPTLYLYAAAAALFCAAAVPSAAVAAPAPAAAETDGALRPVTPLSRGWRFIRKDVPAALKPGYNDSAWRLLDLPHDWTAEGTYSKDNPSGPRCGYLPTGIGTYRKTVRFPKAQFSNGRRLWLEFGGVFRNSSVYVNGRLMGTRAYGWISFGYDITDALRPDGTAEIAVRVDNSAQPAARWYTGSGIYADVSAVSVAPLSIARHGLFVSTPEVNGGEATVRVSADLQNRGTAGEPSLQLTVLDPHGRTAATALVRADALTASDTARTLTAQLKVRRPDRWSPDSPALYTLRATVLNNGVATDSRTVRFGIRSLRFDAKTGFWLNGVSTKLRGVADHWAAGALGAAVPESVLRDRILQLKRMGCNAIRTAHNARPDMFYRLCDELGMLVMDEIFDGWHNKSGNDYGKTHFRTDWRRDVTEWTLRDRNHPSVILRSIGNETGLSDSNGIAKVIRALDSTRPVTGGGVIRGVDVVGVNGPSEAVGYRQPDPSRPFVCTEGPHTWQVRGMYETQSWYRDGIIRNMQQVPNLTPTEIFAYDWEENPRYKRGFQSSYDNATARAPARYAWSVTRDTPWRMGEFRWTGFDYLGEASYVSGGWPYRIFTSGAIDCANFEKDLYYFYQSQWTSPDTAPMVHILPSWTHPIMKPGTKIPVWVYSNCETVELFRNGVSLGRITRGPSARRPWDKMQFDWLVPWAPGTLKAVGFRPDGKAAAEESVSTAGIPAKLRLSSPNAGRLPADAAHTEQVTAAITDAQGHLYPYGENRIWFAVSGPAAIRALDSGTPVIREESHAFTDNYEAFMGLLKLFLQSKDGTGDVLLTAAAILGESRAITSDKVSVDVAHLILRGSPKIPSTEVYYTLDGSEPTRASARYTGAFSVKQGTTVRALVLADGKPLLKLRETFAPDRGLAWRTGAAPTEDASAASGKKTAVTVPDNAPTVLLQPACLARKSRIGLTPDNREVRIYDTDHVGPYAYWHVVDRPDGSACLVSFRRKLFLGAKNGRLVLLPRPSDLTRWTVNGDREGFDYIRHAASGKRLGLSPDGKKLLLLPAGYGNDADFVSNRAYWLLKPVKP